MADEHNLRDLVEEVHRAVVDAFAREHHPEEAERRSALINALQGIIEKSTPNAQNKADIDFEDLFVLVQHREVMIDAAHLHERHFGNTHVGQVLKDISGNIERAQQFLWQPKMDGLHLEHDADRDSEPQHTAVAAL